MILTVCLNPGVDVTYTLPSFVRGTSVTVEQVEKRAGGKGINTARALAQLGEAVVVCGFAGGQVGRWLRSMLATDALVEKLTPIEDETRQCVIVFDGEDATVLNERGPTVSDAEWLAVLVEVERELEEASAISLSGSVPRGCPPDAYAQLIRLAHAHGVPSVLDTSGSQLSTALSAGPDITAPNFHELRSALGEAGNGIDLLSAATELQRRTGGAVVVSAGENGLVAVSGGQRWSAQPERILVGNPTGAGDALTAALARGLSRSQDWPTMLTESIALAGAAIASPFAGDIDLAAYHLLLSNSTVREL